MTKEQDPNLNPDPDPSRQRHGSADPDPHQTVMDPEHCFPVIRTRIFPCIHMDQVGSSDIEVGLSGSMPFLWIRILLCFN
jgi:hypothetical protein